MIKTYHSPCGDLTIGAKYGKIFLCDWKINPHRITIEAMLKKADKENAEIENATLQKAVNQLDEYFKGIRKKFDMPLLFNGTDFQKKVWSATSVIGYGSTASYSEIARRIGQPTATRAVANALGANPISIFIPCHRIIGSNGSITGYAGGVEVKRFLLKMERD